MDNNIKGVVMRSVCVTRLKLNNVASAANIPQLIFYDYCITVATSGVIPSFLPNLGGSGNHATVKVS